MQNVFIINAHEPWPFSEGKLNRSMFERATTHLQSKGYGIQTTTMQDDYDVEKEIEKHMWADVSDPANPLQLDGCAVDV